MNLVIKEAPSRIGEETYTSGHIIKITTSHALNYIKSMISNKNTLSICVIEHFGPIQFPSLDKPVNNRRKS
jgi:hypothetical protein